MLSFREADYTAGWPFRKHHGVTRDLLKQCYCGGPTFFCQAFSRRCRSPFTTLNTKARATSGKVLAQAMQPAAPAPVRIRWTAFLIARQRTGG